MKTLYCNNTVLIQLKNFPSYAITKDGKVFSLDYRHQKKIQELQPVVVHGYEYVNLWKNKIFCRQAIHRLVAETFLSLIEGKNHVNHKNLNIQDNRIENLEWCSHSENMQHAKAAGVHIITEKRREMARRNGSKTGAKNGKKSGYKRAKLSYEQAQKIKEKLKMGIRQNVLAVIYRVSKQTICNIAHDKRQTYI